MTADLCSGRRVDFRRVTTFSDWLAPERGISGEDRGIRHVTVTRTTRLDARIFPLNPGTYHQRCPPTSPAALPNRERTIIIDPHRVTHNLHHHRDPRQM